MGTPDEVLTQKHNRVFTQDGGARPNIPPRLSSVNNQHLAVDGLTIPVRGGVDRIRVHDPARPGRFKTVGTSESPADFPTFTVMVREKHGAIPKALTGSECPFNLYINSGKCANLADFLGGWTDYVTIASQCEVTNIDGGMRASFDTDDVIEDSIDVTATGGVYFVGGLSFGDSGGATVSVEMLDVTFGNNETCGNCGPINDGTKWIYALSTTGASPAGVVYSVDGGLTWTALAITGMGAAEVPTAIEVIGDKLVVFSKLGGGATLSSHFITTINQKTGVPGSAWTEITSGYVATFTVNDVVVVSPREVYIVATGGYVYFTDNIAAGVTVMNAAGATTSDLNRVSSDGAGTVVAVGASGAVIKSVNYGATFAAVAAAPVVATLTAVAVLDENRFWVGSNAGNAYYTLDGGESWATKAFTGSGSGTVNDIVAATDEVLYIAHTVGGAGTIHSSWDGGYQFTNGARRIFNVPTNQRLNRLAVPRAGTQTTQANRLLAAGLGTGTDGIILLGVANIL